MNFDGIAHQDFPKVSASQLQHQISFLKSNQSGATFAAGKTSFSVRRRNFPFLGIHSCKRKSANLFTSLAPKSQFQITFTFTICGALTECTAVDLSRRWKLKRPSVSVRDHDQTFAWVSSSKLTRDRENNYRRSSRLHVWTALIVS